MQRARIPIWLRPPPAKKHRISTLLTANSLPALVFAVVGLWLYSSYRFRIGHPPVGTYVGVLAFVAAIVTIWPPDNVRAKAAWIIIFGGFLVLEITTLYRQRGEDQQTDREKRREEDDRLATILKDNQHAFEATMRNMQGLATISKTALNELTGGGGYVYVEPFEPTIASGIVFVNTNIIVKGRFPMPGVHITIDNVSKQDLIFDKDYGSLPPHTQFGKPMMLPRLEFKDSDPSPQIFSVFINTNAASFNEQIRLEKVGNKWMRATTLFKYGKGRIFRFIEPGFPIDSIGRDWGVIRR